MHILVMHIFCFGDPHILFWWPEDFIVAARGFDFAGRWWPTCLKSNKTTHFRSALFFHLWYLRGPQIARIEASHAFASSSDRQFIKMSILPNSWIAKLNISSTFPISPTSHLKLIALLNLEFISSVIIARDDLSTGQLNYFEHPTIRDSDAVITVKNIIV